MGDTEKVVNYLEAKAKKYDDIAFELSIEQHEARGTIKAKELRDQVESNRMIRDSFEAAADVVRLEENLQRGTQNG